MNEHESVRAMLALAAAGALDAADSTRVERHASACEECRRELKIWGLYAQGLQHLPQPSLPADLRLSTQRLILAGAASPRRDHLTLGALALFGWASSLSMWVLARVFTGGAVNVFGVNLVNGFTWLVTSSILAWVTAATAAAMLQTRRSV